MKTKKTDFYITYHHGDEMAARWIAAELKQARFSTLSDSWDFLPGEAPNEKIEYMFTVSRYAMVLISERFLQSHGDLVKSFGKSRLDQERSKPRFWQDKISIRHIDFELEQMLENRLSKIDFFLVFI